MFLMFSKSISVTYDFEIGGGLKDLHNGLWSFSDSRFRLILFFLASIPATPILLR